MKPHPAKSFTTGKKICPKSASDTARQALEWNPRSESKVVRPVKTWRGSLEEELKLKKPGLRQKEQLRTESVVIALCSTRNVMA